MSTRDYYEILGVDKTADEDSIKRAYRKLAMQYHPDRNPGDKSAEEKFREAAEAYEVLSNSDKRSQYDRFGHQAFKQGAGGGGFSNAEDIFSHFGDIFGDLFGSSFGGGGFNQGRSRRKNEPRRGADLRYFADIHLEEVLTGTQKDIEFETEESCQDCKGTGAEKGSQVTTCPQCGGSGQVVSRQGFFAMATTCGKCRGQGTVVEKPCKSCRGQGRKNTKRKIQVNIPAGVDTGTRLRVGGEGEGGYMGGAAGDLYVEIRVRENDRFERDGDDLHSEVDVSYLQLILGAEVILPGLDQEVKLEIPKGFQPGNRIKVSGRGLPSLRGSRRGDLYYRIHVHLPEKPSKDEERHLREIAQSLGLKVKEESSGIFGKRK